MFYIAIAILLLVGLLFLLRVYSNADPVKIKKIYKVTKIIIGVIFVILLLKVGLPYIAALLGGAMALAPYFSKFVRFLYTVRFLKGFLNNAKPSCSANNSSNKIMTKKQACEILDVQEDASKAQIEEAYKRLMKKNHPDIGGSKYIATELNKAKDILLKDKK